MASTLRSAAARSVADALRPSSRVAPAPAPVFAPASASRAVSRVRALHVHDAPGPLHACTIEIRAVTILTVREHYDFVKSSMKRSNSIKILFIIDLEIRNLHAQCYLFLRLLKFSDEYNLCLLQNYRVRNFSIGISLTYSIV